jgi:hypothetical protein
VSGQAKSLKPGHFVDASPTSRPDVAVRVVEQDPTRSVITLDGPAGAVNVALVTSTNGKPRTICSWKFEIDLQQVAGRA